MTTGDNGFGPVPPEQSSFSWPLFRFSNSLKPRVNYPKCNYFRDADSLKECFHLTYNKVPMKAYVYVSLKKSVLDPQGKTIQSALKKMGYKGLEDVRQGKYFEIALDGDLTRTEAQAEVERMAREVLTNPVIEEFRFSLED